MFRVEIIANISLEEDFKEALLKLDKKIYYTIIPVVHGRGRKGEKRGDGIWPEENFLMIIYLKNREKLQEIKEIIKQLNANFPTEGIEYFIIETEDL